jgi:salicylate hydroxylase
MFEISCRSLIEPAADKERRFSWGIDVSNEKVVRHFKEYDPRVRETMEQVPSGMWKEFSAFAGPRLEKVTAWDGKVALLGDASHPLSGMDVEFLSINSTITRWPAGAFGSGAAFALEDGWIIAKAIERTWGQPNALAEALKIFDTIRSPYYVRM